MKTACLLSLLLSASCAFAQKSASVMINGGSIQILPSNAQFVAGVGNVAAYFTTYNGSGSPLVTSNGIVSGEIRPRAGSAGLYEGGYLVATPVASVDYGSYAVSVPTTDADGDGTPDLLQFDKAGNFSATGSGLSVATNSPFSITVTFARAAGAATGSYSARTQSAAATTTYTGIYALSAFAGSVSYVRGAANTMTFTLTSQASGTTLTGSTTYTTSNNDQLSYAAFTAHNTSGDSYQVLAGTLTRSGTAYRGDLALVDGLPETYWADFTKYRLTITDSNDANGNGVPDLTDGAILLQPPVFTTQPQSQTVTTGANVTFTATASGSPTYQWWKDGVPLSGATLSTVTIVLVTAANAGTYTVVATNSAGSTTSNAATLAVNAPAGSAPVIVVQPQSQTVAPGSTVGLNVTATGTRPSYQWFQNGRALPGATSAVLAFDSVSEANAGDYTVNVTTTGGTTTSRLARLVVAAPDPGRIANLSVRALTGVGGQALTVGFIVNGGSKSLLVRASGPALGALGVPGTIADPRLQVHQKINSQDVVVASNDNWSSDPNAAAVAAVPGPFPFSPGSKDAALLLNVDGDRTALASDGAGATGVTLVEVYDVGTGNSPRLVNVSTLNFAGTGDNVLIAGFIISGNLPKTLLIRGVGPALSGFGVSNTLADPVMEIHGKDSSGRDIVVATNDNWQDEPNAANAAAIPGPFALDAGSKDAALLITLPAGAYTVQVAGAGQTTGNALIEVYDIQ